MRGPCSASACGGAALLGVAAPLRVHAQTAPGPTVAVQLPGQVERVPLTAGRSTVLRTDFDIMRIAITNPAVADATVVQPREILVDGKSPAP